MRALQAAVFGPDSLANSLPRSVYLASLPQALAAQRLCVAALLDLVAPANCLSLAALGAATGVEPLRARAAACALQHFSEAATLDYSGLVGLEEAALMALLCSDDLQVETELDAFRALVAWTEHDRAARLPGFAPRLARAVRLARMEPSDLVFLDVHPVVRLGCGGCPAGGTEPNLIEPKPSACHAAAACCVGQCLSCSKHAWLVPSH